MHPVRHGRYRYIRYKNGDEELYETENDPHEWNNLADQRGSRKIMDELARWLPDHDASEIGPPEP